MRNRSKITRIAVLLLGGTAAAALTLPSVAVGPVGLAGHSWSGSIVAGHVWSGAVPTGHGWANGIMADHG